MLIRLDDPIRIYVIAGDLETERRVSRFGLGFLWLARAMRAAGFAS